MPFVPSTTQLPTVLPGEWNLQATNFPNWFSGERRNPRLSWRLRSEQPLSFDAELSYLADDGLDKREPSVDRWSGAEFSRRGKGAAALFPTRWTIEGSNAEQTVLVIRLQKSFVSPAGIDIIVRDGHPIRELRSLVANTSEQLGLTAEDFASLTWLAPTI